MSLELYGYGSADKREFPAKDYEMFLQSQFSEMLNNDMAMVKHLIKKELSLCPLTFEQEKRLEIAIAKFIAYKKS